MFDPSAEPSGSKPLPERADLAVPRSSECLETHILNSRTSQERFKPGGREVGSGDWSGKRLRVGGFENQPPSLLIDSLDCNMQ